MRTLIGSLLVMVITACGSHHGKPGCELTDTCDAGGTNDGQDTDAGGYADQLSVTVHATTKTVDMTLVDPNDPLSFEEAATDSVTDCDVVIGKKVVGTTDKPFKLTANPSALPDISLGDPEQMVTIPYVKANPDTWGFEPTGESGLFPLDDGQAIAPWTKPACAGTECSLSLSLAKIPDVSGIWQCYSHSLGDSPDDGGSPFGEPGQMLVTVLKEDVPYDGQVWKAGTVFLHILGMLNSQGYWGSRATVVLDGELLSPAPFGEYYGTLVDDTLYVTGYSVWTKCSRR